MQIQATQSSGSALTLPRDGFFDDLKSIFVTPGELKDAMEAVGTCFEWVPYFTDRANINAFANRTSSELTIRNAFHLTNLFGNLAKLRNEYRTWWKTDDPDCTRRIYNAAMLSTFNTAGVTLFLNAFNIINLGGLLPTAKTVFWGTLGGVDAVGVFHHLGTLESLQAAKVEAKSDEMKELVQHKINLAYLSIAKSLTTVAMAAISLVGILFAALAQGILFTPVVMLGLSSAWLILNFTHFFYSRMVDRAEERLPAGTV